MSRIPDDHRFEVVPDWTCEILSPSTASKDREIKLPLYAHYGVAYAWLVDPKPRTLEACGLEQGQRVFGDEYSGTEYSGTDHDTSTDFFLGDFCAQVRGSPQRVADEIAWCPT